MSPSAASGTMGATIHVVPSSSTWQLSIKNVFMGTTIAVPPSVVVEEANSILRDAQRRYFQVIGLPEIGDDYTDEEELEWETFFAQPRVQAELERLSQEAERQFAAGETEEGGFAIE